VANRQARSGSMRRWSARPCARSTGCPGRSTLPLHRPSATCPGWAMLATKLGAVTEHPANLHRLLHDEGQLVLRLSRGTPGRVKPLSSRYRLRSFDRLEIISLAIQARCDRAPWPCSAFPESDSGAEFLGPALSPDARFASASGCRSRPGSACASYSPSAQTALGGKRRVAWPGQSCPSSPRTSGHWSRRTSTEMVAARRSVWLGYRAGS